MATMTQPANSTTIKLAAPLVAALKECDDELRAVALELFAQLASGELDPHEEASTLNLLAEILYPNADDKGMPGLDLAEAEQIAAGDEPEAARILADMNRQEGTFADRLQVAMTERGVTQAELAEKIGVGQPAVSMMLNRTCRPQKKTVQKIATALGVKPADLWPV